jgi:hypothetical protein
MAVKRLMEKRKALRAEKVIRERQFNAASRALTNVTAQLDYLEKRIELARVKQEAVGHE